VSRLRGWWFLIMNGRMDYLGGAMIGFSIGMIGLLAVLPRNEFEVYSVGSSWLALNLGHSAWLFCAVFVFYLANLKRLNDLLARNRIFKEIVSLDQLSDIWIHLFIGIGVVWTAVGMRSALETTLAAPEALAEGAGDVLARLVEGGILLALTTTIVGAIGGYLMRLFKTMWLGAELTEFYRQEDRREMFATLAHLSRIEMHLESLVESGSK
jgi:hypothetical protein